MPFSIIEGDITLIKADAIVNAANSTLRGGGGVDGAIHKAAGPGLLKECISLGGCEEGDAKITAGYLLPAKHVIHTVGPVWYGGEEGEAEVLASCYRTSLRLARENGCRSVAFPLISAGAYGYPKDAARRIAEDEIRGFLHTLPESEEMDVTLVLFDRRDCTLEEGLASALENFIASGGTEYFPLPGGIMNFAEAFIAGNRERIRSERRSASPRRSPVHAGEIVESLLEKIRPASKTQTGAFEDASAEEAHAICEAPAAPDWDSVESAVRSLDESFSQMLLRKIRESGMSEPACYRRANIDRKLFSKIRSNIRYRPKKTTALAFAVALELPLDETRELLEKAGFALSHSSTADLIVEYFIRNGIWDIFTINDALFRYDQVPLGA